MAEESVSILWFTKKHQASNIPKFHSRLCVNFSTRSTSQWHLHRWKKHNAARFTYRITLPAVNEDTPGFCGWTDKPDKSDEDECFCSGTQDSSEWWGRKLCPTRSVTGHMGRFRQGHNSRWQSEAATTSSEQDASLETSEQWLWTKKYLTILPYKLTRRSEVKVIKESDIWLLSCKTIEEKNLCLIVPYFCNYCFTFLW